MLRQILETPVFTLLFEFLFLYIIVVGAIELWNTPTRKRRKGNENQNY